MPRALWAACGLLVLAGCGRSDPTAGSRAPVHGVVPPIQPEPSPAWNQLLEEPAGPTLYAGQPVEAWVEQFQAADPAGRAQAATALGQMGKPGFRPLLEGMKSQSDDTRILALQAVTEEVLTAPDHRPQTFPLLLGMLADRNPEIRRQAADRLAWFFGPEHLGPGGPSAELFKAVQALRYLMKNDPEASVRQVAESAIHAITSRVTGRPVAGSPDDPKLPF